ncbi:MAG: hypothetical protein ACR5KW_02615 [Wolbachia sp.]
MNDSLEDDADYAYSATFLREMYVMDRNTIYSILLQWILVGFDLGVLLLSLYCFSKVPN